MDSEAYGQKNGPGAGKKDSIFSGLNPASPSALRAEAESAAVLKQKIDGLERNLAAILEKKLDEQLKASAAGAKNASADAERLHKKIEDIEKELAEFGERSALAADETKKDGELKAGALKGLGSLLETLGGQFERTAGRLDDLEAKMAHLSELAASGQAAAAKAMGAAATKIVDLHEDAAESFAEIKKDTASGIAGLQKDTAAGFAALQKDGVAGLAGIKDMAESLSGMRKEMGDTLPPIKDMAEVLGAMRKETVENLVALRKEMSENISGIRKEMGESLAGIRKDTWDTLERMEKKISVMSEAVAGMQEKTEAAVKDDAARDAEIAAHLENLERKMHNFYEISRIEQSARDAAGKTTDVYLVKLAAQLEAFGKEIDGLKTFVSVERARAVEAAGRGEEKAKEYLAELGQKVDYFSKAIMRGQTRRDEEERTTREELKKKMELLSESLKRDSRLMGDRLAVGDKRLSDILQALEKAMPEKYSAEVRTAAGTLKDVHEELRERAASFSGAIETFHRLAAEHKVRSETVEKVIGGNDALLKDTFEKISLLVKQNGERFLLELGEKNRTQFENLNTKYADALANMRAMDAVYSSLDAVSRRLEAYQTKCEGFLTAVDKEQLAAMLGVSGTRIRKNLDAIGEMVSEMKREAAYLEGVKKDMGDRLREAFKKPD